jgi:cytosine/uracil/thiamine/allantoin permease
VGIAVVAFGLAAWLTMERYESFLFLLGSVFIPLFGILIADHFVNRRRRIDMAALYEREGDYWYSGGVRAGALLPWVAGFVLYHWIAPTGPDWWLEWNEGLFGTPLSARLPWLSASLPSFAIAFAGTLLLGRGRGGGRGATIMSAPKEGPPRRDSHT